ncbi:MAG TPA: mercury methylation corrinoid protein HgcA, partial [Patescibacteria group bacterium]|nr:mercury methylation corrinoid protein HgcA [Patescibacteria group bacterium]
MVSEFDIPDLEYFNLAENLHINKNSWIKGFIEGPYGKIPVLKSSLDKLDRLGAIKVRLGIGRDSYSVLPGLYAIGSPDKSSPVLVTANYKLTLDMLRKELKDVNAWIVVVDTKGINVWCAAGKGTFSTYEVIKKIKELKLKDLVNHRKIILPQLCASGVAAYQVLKNSGFKAVFGPIRAEDINIFLQNGMK